MPNFWPRIVAVFRQNRNGRSVGLPPAEFARASERANFPPATAVATNKPDRVRASRLVSLPVFMPVLYRKNRYLARWFLWTGRRKLLCYQLQWREHEKDCGSQS